MKKNRTQYNKGFSLVETLIALSIFSIVLVIVGTFQRDVFSLNFVLQDSLNAQLDARHLIKTMISELRKTTQSSVGSYAIDTAATSTMTFYSDVNSDGLVDKVRYFLTGTVIKKGVTRPTGAPLTYNSANEVVTTLINSAVSSSTMPLFQYYPSSYAGTSTPLAIPVDVSQVRLVKITIIIDKNPFKSPSKIVVTSVVNLRNLKDNL